MKTFLSCLFKAFGQRLTYWMALYQLRSLEITLHDTCNALPDVVDIEGRTQVAQCIRRLSGAVVEARNRVRALRPAAYRRQGWRTA